METASLDLNLLRTFLAVYRSGSFTGAARLLGLSQPTVTTQMRALERQTGRELFERLPRGVAPTPVADELAARIAAPLDELAAVAGPTPPAGTGAEPVHLAGPAELLCTKALPALAPLVAEGVRLRVATGLTDPLLEELRAGRHDLVIATTRPRGRTLQAVALTDEEFVLVAAPVWAERLTGRRGAQGSEARPAAAQGGLDPAVLHGVPLVTYAEDLPIARRYWRHVFGRRLSRTAAVTVPDLRGVLAAVVAGAGFSVLPRYLCQDLLDSGALVALLEPEDPPINTGFLVQRPGASDNPDVARVRALLLRAARDW
ncbi:MULTISPECIES: LysR family transcriptional regulator [Streptomyces]|uniref:LysR family transcriptional regulator n=1 Tax=Streptomyces tricolor TaxID=68277 RepID=A0ABS9JHR8_9ACTN|nr:MULTISPECIES: LysR family transcriptional regulator [Streptomyces]MCG0065125.1 LysR family transcriptional regulator [Streptomyces tricolor]OYP13738.1 LysR family transcriptional regulator [Streptomyces sp. FBKL.4005]BCM65541.1 putative LysR-family transcriptional regulator [Streptomyces sp. EAS-AB2608]